MEAGARAGGSPAGIAGWTAKGASAVLDQGLFAGGNFLLSLALARWLDPADYGAYALAWSVFLLLAAFHTALVTEPMLVFGPGRYGKVFSRYMGTLLGLSTAVTLVPALLLAAAGGILEWTGQPLLSRTFYALAVMAPCVLMLWLVRRAFYALMKPIWAAFGGAFYFLAILGGVAGLSFLGVLSPATALLAMAAASLLASAVLTIVLRPGLAGEPVGAGEVAARHWGYGRWSSATTMLTWLPANIYYVLLPTVAGLGGSGSLKAVMNLLMPVFHATSAVAVLLVPAFVRALREGGARAFREHVERAAGLLVAGGLVYGVLLAFFGEPVFRILYAGRYTDEAGLLLYALPFPATAAAVAVLGGALRAMERPDLIFRCYVVSTLVALVAGLPLLYTYGVAGSLLAQLASSAVTAAAMGYYWLRSRMPVEETA